jgi:hypothetical protein
MSKEKCIVCGVELEQPSIYNNKTYCFEHYSEAFDKHIEFENQQYIQNLNEIWSEIMKMKEDQFMRWYLK